MRVQSEGRAGLVTVTFRQLSPEKIVEIARLAGLKVLEWGGDVHVPAGDTQRAHKVAALTRESGLETICYGSYYRVGHDGEGGKSCFADVLATAVALEAPSIRVWAGTCASDVADDAYFSRVCDDANRIADLADKQGVRIAFEFHEGTLNDNAEAAAKLLSSLPLKNVDTLWQPLAGLCEEQRNRSLEVVLPRLAHVHVFHWLPGAPVIRQPLAEGAVYWAGWIKTMRHSGCITDLLLEFVRGDDPSHLAAEATLLHSLTGSGQLGTA